MCAARPRGETSIFVIDANTSECLHYEAVAGYPPKAYSRIPREVLNEHPELEIRNDLIDCYIDICSVEVSMFAAIILLCPNPFKLSGSLTIPR